MTPDTGDHVCRSQSNTSQFDSKCVVHVEFLHNIKSLNVAIQLATARNEQTSLSVSEHGRRLELLHDSQTCSVHLPIQTSTLTGLNTILPSLGKCSSVGRLQVDPASNGTIQDEGSTIPWSASDLDDTTELSLIHI